MAEREYKEGDEVTGPGGPDDVLVLKNNEWVRKTPSSTIDVIKSIPGGLVRGGVGLITTPFNLADIASRGAEWGAGQLPESWHDTAGKVRRGAQAVQQAVYPGTYQGGMEQIEKDFGKFYEPQTMAGRIAEGAAEFAPSMVGGPGGLMIKALRGLGRGAAMSGAGEAARQVGHAAGVDPKYDPYLSLAGAGATLPASVLARRVVTPNPVTDQLGKMRLDQANRLKAAGVDVDAAQALNSQRLARWADRGAPPGQAEQLTRAMMEKGGAGRTLGTIPNVEAAEAANLAAIGKHGSLPQLQRQKQNLVPLRKAAEKAQTQPGNMGIISPSDVLKSSKNKSSDLSKLAEAGTNVAKPIDVGDPSYHWSKVAAALGGLAAPSAGTLLHGGMPGMMSGEFGAGLGTLGYLAAPEAIKVARSATVGPLTRSKLGNTWLTNQAWMPGSMSTLDPVTAAKLLATPKTQQIGPQSGITHPVSITVHPKHYDEDNVTTVPRSPSPYPVVPLSQ